MTGNLSARDGRKGLPCKRTLMQNECNDPYAPLCIAYARFHFLAPCVALGIPALSSLRVSKNYNLQWRNLLRDTFLIGGGFREENVGCLNTYSIIIIIITRFSCLEARCVCRQAAVKAAKTLPFVGLARSKQDLINGGHGAQYFYQPPPAGAHN